jgi:hypothetical protein
VSCIPLQPCPGSQLLSVLFCCAFCADHEADQVNTCRSPGGLADDSFTNHRHSPSSPARGRADGTHHSPQHNSVMRSSLRAGPDSDMDEEDMPGSPLLHISNKQQQQQQQQLQFPGDGVIMPLSTHARIVPANGKRSPRNSSKPGQSSSTPTWHATGAAAEQQGQYGDSRTPRAVGEGTQQLLPPSPLQQQQQQGADGHSRRQPQVSQQWEKVSQQWESIELSSSPFSSDSNRDQSSPSALAGLRPREQLPVQPSPLRPQRDPLQAGAAVAGTGAAAATTVATEAASGPVSGVGLQGQDQQQ